MNAGNPPGQRDHLVVTLDGAKVKAVRLELADGTTTDPEKKKPPSKVRVVDVVCLSAAAAAITIVAILAFV